MSAFDIVGCPECHLPAEVHDRYTMPSTDGPLEHIVIECLGGHAFNMPTEWLERLRNRSGG